MMKKLSKHTKRRGAQPTKVLFSIEVVSLCNLLPSLSSIGDDALLSVCFERYRLTQILGRNVRAFNPFCSFKVTFFSSLYYLSLRRGGKMSCSTGIPFDCSPGSGGTLSVDQTLSLVATLYQESNGDFQEKTAKLILRQSKVKVTIIGYYFVTFCCSTTNQI
jgi:hypothetical protein